MEMPWCRRCMSHHSGPEMCRGITPTGARVDDVDPVFHGCRDTFAHPSHVVETPQGFALFCPGRTAPTGTYGTSATGRIWHSTAPSDRY